MTRIISALLVALSSAAICASATAQEAQPQAAGSKPSQSNAFELAADAPDRHIVVPGDTLWAISSKFVKDPKRWPQLWRLNDEQIKNPHRIYPGQILVLRRGAEPYIELETVRIQPKEIDTPLADSISAIPQNVIEPYLAQPLIIEADALASAPRIIALQEGRLMIGPGGNVYATGIKSQHAQTFQLYRPGKPMVDPTTKEVLGHEAVFLGTAKLIQAGDPAVLMVSNSIHEIGLGDRLTPMPKVDIVSYVPHAPKQATEARVITTMGTVIGGQFSVVTLSRGKRDGIEIGHVLALQSAGIDVTEASGSHKGTKFKLPDERYGLVFVFRVFDRVSYALVMQTSREVTAGDYVRTP